MRSVSATRVGFGVGGAGATAYIACAVIMTVLPHAWTIRFFNSLMHGVDVSGIMRWDISLVETGIGIGETFIIGWIFGAIAASLYNNGLNHGDETRA